MQQTYCHSNGKHKTVIRTYVLTWTFHDLKIAFQKFSKFQQFLNPSLFPDCVGIGFGYSHNSAKHRSTHAPVQSFYVHVWTQRLIVHACVTVDWLVSLHALALEQEWRVSHLTRFAATLEALQACSLIWTDFLSEVMIYKFLECTTTTDLLGRSELALPTATRLLRAKPPKPGGRWECRLIEINRLIHIAKQGGQKGLAYVIPEPRTRYEQSWLRRKCEKILQQCEKLHQIRIPRPVLRMKGRQQLGQSKGGAVRGHDTALPSTKLCDSSSQKQCESKCGDTGSPSTELGDCSSQQQCESKIGVSLDKGTLASFFTSPAQSRCKDQSVAGEASKIGADGKKTKQLQQNRPGLRLQQLRLMSHEGKLSDTSIDKKARLNFDRAMLPGESMYTAEELREILRELPSWDSYDLPFEGLLRVVTPGEEICTIVAREACRILQKEHPDVWGLVDPQVEYMTDRTEAQRKSKQACYDRIYGGGVNPAGSKYWVLLTSGVFAMQTNMKRMQSGAMDPSETGCWEPRQPVGIRNFGNTCYLNTALQAIAPMFTEAACVVSWELSDFSWLCRPPDKNAECNEPRFTRGGNEVARVGSFPLATIQEPLVFRSKLLWRANFLTKLLPGTGTFASGSAAESPPVPSKSGHHLATHDETALSSTCAANRLASPALAVRTANVSSTLLLDSADPLLHFLCSLTTPAAAAGVFLLPQKNQVIYLLCGVTEEEYR
eukprot:g76808.t1